MLYICVGKNEGKETAIIHYIILFLFYVNSQSVLLNVGIKREPYHGNVKTLVSWNT